MAEGSGGNISNSRRLNENWLCCDWSAVHCWSWPEEECLGQDGVWRSGVLDRLHRLDRFMFLSHTLIDSDFLLTDFIT